MGRPTKLDEATARAIIDALRVGCPIRVACQAAGVGPTTFKSWVARGKSPDEADAPYRAFRADVQKARAAGEAAALKVIHAAMPTTWQAAAWFLERSRPARWARAGRYDRKPEAEALTVRDAIMEARRADEEYERERHHERGHEPRPVALTLRSLGGES